jgi:nicotinamidase-related amidase
MQNDYFLGGANELVGAEKASQNTKAILKRFRGCNKPVVHIQHVSTRPEATFFILIPNGVEHI